MKIFNRFGRSRRLLSVSLVCAGLVLAGCADDEDVTATGSPFSQALFKDYTDLSTAAASAPAPEGADNGGFFSDMFNMFGSGPDNPADAVAEAFHAKANRAAGGDEPQPEPALPGAEAQNMRARLVRAIAQNKDQFPDEAARAQSDFDCWVLDSGVSSLAAQAEACRSALNNSLLALERAARPVLAPAPAPRPAPVIVPPPAAVAQPGDYTVYFDFDSWTLTAEDLTVITNVIDTARAGGQSRITVVGHTDTSVPASLIINDCRCVAPMWRSEALRVMLARAAPLIQASGVGGGDLAVETPRWRQGSQEPAGRD